MSADHIITSNYIFTGLNDEPEPGFIALKDGRIIETGQGSFSHLEGKQTQLHAHPEQMVMPGFHDSHLHFESGIMQQQGVNLWNATSEKDAVQMVADFAAERPEDEIIFGYDWNPYNWKNSEELPTAQTLDQIISDRPVVLFRFELHGAWLNSCALKRFKITGETVAPKGGIIYLDDRNKPTGYLHDTATFLIHKHTLIPPKLDRRYYTELIAHLNSLGITGLSHLQMAGSANDRLLHALEMDGELSLRFGFSIALNSGLAEGRRLRKYDSDNLYFRGYKAFLDGTALGYTADLLEPYTNKPDTTNLHPVDFPAIREAFLKADAEGFRIRMHAIGDQAIRNALDLCEEAQKTNGIRDARHSIAHCELIDPADRQRFAQLNVIADIHPAHITLDSNCYSGILYPDYVGTRSSQCFAYQSLLQAGASYAMGSDFPVTTPNPFIGIYRALTRRFNDGQPADGWLPNERLSLPQILRGYTRGSAFHDFLEQKTGTLEAGKYADLIVLSDNLFTCTPEQIKCFHVAKTFFNGRIVHTRPE